MTGEYNTNSIHSRVGELKLKDVRDVAGKFAIREPQGHASIYDEISAAGMILHAQRAAGCVAYALILDVFFDEI